MSGGTAICAGKGFLGARVRHVEIDGEPWFSAKDVLAALDIKGDTSRQLDKLDPDTKRVVVRRALSPSEWESHEHLFPPRAPSVTLISEAGVYRLAQRSDKPEAVRFQSWMAEVAVSLRKRGSFTVGQEALDEAEKDALAVTARRELGSIIGNRYLRDGKDDHAFLKLSFPRR